MWMLSRIELSLLTNYIKIMEQRCVTESVCMCLLAFVCVYVIMEGYSLSCYNCVFDHSPSDNRTGWLGVKH